MIDTRGRLRVDPLAPGTHGSQLMIRIHRHRDVAEQTRGQLAVLQRIAPEWLTKLEFLPLSEARWAATISRKSSKMWARTAAVLGNIGVLRDPIFECVERLSTIAKTPTLNVSLVTHRRRACIEASFPTELFDLPEVFAVLDRAIARLCGAPL
jgi:hypothetical protein